VMCSWGREQRCCRGKSLHMPCFFHYTTDLGPMTGCYLTPFCAILLICSMGWLLWVIWIALFVHLLFPSHSIRTLFSSLPYSCDVHNGLGYLEIWQESVLVCEYAGFVCDADCR
jgi:hypothetical protein